MSSLAKLSWLPKFVIHNPTTPAGSPGGSKTIPSGPVVKTAPVSRQSAVNLNYIRYLNPVLAGLISTIRPPAAGEPRQKMTVPICPVEIVTDEVLFEAAADPTKKFYLPRYRLKEQNGQFQISLAPNGQGWALSVNLEKYPAAKISEPARNAKEINHGLRIILKHRLGISYREQAFQEVTAIEGGIRAVLRIATIDELDLLYDALTKTTNQTTLTIQRIVEVAIPVGALPEASRSIVSSGVTTWRGGYTFNFDKGVIGEGTGDVWWQQQSSTIRKMVPRGKAQLINLGLVNFEALTVAQLQGLKYTSNLIDGSIGSNPNAVIMVTPNWNPGGKGGVYNNHPIGVWFVTTTGRWSVFNQDFAAMPNGAAFNIDAKKTGATVFVHRATSSNISANSTFIDHSLTNQNPNAILMVTPNYNPGGQGGSYNKHAFGVWYDLIRKKWAIFNQDRTPMPNGTTFNVEVLKADNTVFIQRATRSNTTKHYTRLDHLLADKNSNAILMVTPNWNPGGKGGVYNDHEIGVWYDSKSGKWYIFNQDLAAMPDGASFNVAIRKASNTTFTYRVGAPNISGHVCYIDRAIDGGINQLINGDVFAVLTNSGNYAKVKILEYGANLKIQWVTYGRPLAAETALYRKITPALNNTLERTFVFDPNLHGYIFQGVTGTNRTFKPLLQQAPWKGRQYSYYQDPVNQKVFSYLPDAFKICRRPESPHYPMMSVRFESTDGSQENIFATLEFCAFPFVDMARLDNAAETLRSRVPGSPPANTLDFQPLLPVKDAQLFLALPRTDGSSSEELINVVVDLRAGFKHSVTLPLKDFQGIWEAICGGSMVLFQGSIKVDLEGVTEIIPFITQMNDLVGDIFDYEEKPDQTSAGVQITLSNAIESPVKISNLTARLCRRAAADQPCHEGTEISAEIRGLTLPVENLNPGEEVTFTIVPSVPIAGAEPLGALLDFDGVEVLPDQYAVFDAVLNPKSRPEYKKSVTVVAYKELFETDSEIQVLSVDFERGDTVVFKREDPPDKLEKQVNVLAPIKELIVTPNQPTGYKCKMMVIRSGGKKSEKEGEVNSDIFFIVNDDLPPAA